MQATPLTEHEKKKKELLALSEEELIVVVTLMLNNSEAIVNELSNVLRIAYAAEPLIGKWTEAGIKRKLRLLNEKSFVKETYYGYKLENEWRNVAVFAADGLGLRRLDALVKAADVSRGHPANGRVANTWRKDYESIALRCVYYILLGNVRYFDRLFQELTAPLSWAPHTKTAGQKRIEDLLSITDWSFWKKRPDYFRWSSLMMKAERYTEWDEKTPLELDKLLQQLLEDQSGQEDFRYEVRTIALLGIHHFRNRIEMFGSDPALQAVLAWSNGEETAAAAIAPGAIGHDPEESASPVSVILSLLQYSSGVLTEQQMLETVHTFQISEQPVMVNAFYAWVLAENARTEDGERILEEQFQFQFSHPFSWLFVLCTAAWMGLKLRKSWLDDLYHKLERGDFAGVPWWEAEIAAALREVSKYREVQLGGGARVPGSDDRAGRVLGLRPATPAWAYVLRQLRRPTAAAALQEPELRTIWIVDFEEEVVYCKEQKKGARGWSKGRKMKWQELINPENPDILDPADHNAVSALSALDGRRLSVAMAYQDDQLRVDFARMLHAIAEHPRIYLDEKRRIPIELLRGEPELLVTESPGGVLLRFDPPVDAEGYVWKKETPTRYRIYHLSEDQARMAWAIGEGVEVPREQTPVVENLVEDLRATVKVQSAFDLIDEDLERIGGSPKPCFHLLPFGDGYKIELYVKPLPEEPFYFKPGDGLPRSVIVLEDGRKVLERPLDLELEAAREAVAACPTLREARHEMYEWTIDDTQSALRILLELRSLVAAGEILIEHPKGEKLRIVGQAGSDELALRVGKQRDWFEVDGKLTVSEDRVLELEALLEHLQNSDNRFVELAEGEFVALTDELRDRILEMEGLLYRKGKKFQLPGLAAGAFSEMTDDLDDLEFDDAWAESLERIKTAQKIRPRVPKSFRAELRDYQKEGFRWMMRLAAWGVGGCLADDMGLGKTVQALAMLSARAESGPSLVIAPASVTRNWLRETERFAPGLIPVLIASRTDTALLPQLGTGDLALVSYGLIPFIGDELEAKEWGTIVIDEAQAIKNAATKRAKTVQNLQAEFKLATTGTPIENHLGELWSLFRFLNPGLLGGKSAFNEKYNRPIARDGNEERRSALKNIVKPFILRRRKDQVLTELPPKTEVVLEVELSEEEKALYEAMRRNAVREIAQADEQQKRFTVLAQLTKLRQAACHPRLVRPRSRLGSAKLELVGETLLEILENGHKALVFSQFVKHLKIVENWVKGQGIAYQYLDGGTPGKKREEAVNAFQNGEGEVFLISLKAGGTGLNLTEADYVLHLDPWWNPAAEDQASDRAHRIGQQRPVTVYRFVSQGTIEEQIIALHAEKRDLADQILAGTGKAGKLGVDEILTMIRD